jgi:hypothetical protein
MGGTLKHLKVHKNENFFCFDFEFKILGIKFFDWTILAEATIIPHSLKLKIGANKNPILVYL